jgi:glycerol-3-phosphate acyltransferase PlsY
VSESISWSALAAVLLAGYVIGSLPTAYLVARSRGVNIFEVGTGQAGATNVWREVSARLAAVVFLLDVGKGVGAVFVGRLFGLDGAWLLLPALTVTMGHWNSLFTGFRGGDGLSIFCGAAVALIGGAVVIPFAAAATVALGFNSRLSHPTIGGGMTGYITFVIVAQTPSFGVEPKIILGLTGLMFGVLVHSIAYHRKINARRRALVPAETTSPPEPQSQGNA